MTWDETFSQLSADWKTSAPKPARMQELLARLGHPEQMLHFVHIAGTNGKGSASAMTSRILTEAGFRTGLYISPHLFRINERWSVDGREISDDELSAELAALRPVLLAMPDKPTKFEILTALAFLYFVHQHCDIVVLEVGLGGRLDATNVIPVPDCALIMNIGLEHTEVLGDTLEKIAFEKGGIIKEGGTVVLYHQTDAVENVIRSLCREKHAELHITKEPEGAKLPLFREDAENVGGPDAPTPAEDDDSAKAGSGETQLLQYFSYQERKQLALALLGSYQCRNACAVLEVMDVLRKRGFAVSEAAIRRGLRNVSWPGRFEVVSRAPLCILDGAHNPNGVEALTDSIRAYLPDYEITFIMGVMADKDYHEMLRLTAPLAHRFIAEVPDCGSDRGLQNEKLAAEIRKYFSGPVETAPSVTAGLERACALINEAADGRAEDISLAGRPRKQAIVCFGSLYQAAEVRAYFSKASEDRTDLQRNSFRSAIPARDALSSAFPESNDMKLPL